MRTFTTLALITLVASAFSARPAAAHEFPAKAKQIKSALVQNYDACVAPDAATIGGGLPACEELDPIDTLCTFPGAGDGSLSAKISGTGIAVKAKLKGLSPACDGQSLSVAFDVRVTTDDCPGGHCVVTDQTVTGGSCTVAGGRCTISSTIPTAYPAGAGSEFTILSCGVNRGLLASFSCGILIP